MNRDLPEGFGSCGWSGSRPDRKVVFISTGPIVIGMSRNTTLGRLEISTQYVKGNDVRLTSSPYQGGRRSQFRADGQKLIDALYLLGFRPSSDATDYDPNKEPS